LGDGREIVEKKIIRCFDVTPILHDLGLSRGHEIQAWLNEHPEVERYAILDDDNDMLEHQMVNFFQTSCRTGITPEIADRIVAHFTRVRNDDFHQSTDYILLVTELTPFVKKSIQSETG
jgi:Swiss Army Knife RNA repair-like protein